MTSFKDKEAHIAQTLKWPKHLRSPSELIQSLQHKTSLRIIRSPVCSKLVLQFIGGWSFILANVLNKTRIYNLKVFNDQLERIERIQKDKCLLNGVNSQDIKSNGGPLITLSNHISCIDDPVLWGALLPFNYYFTKTDTVRWSAAAIDICFSKPWHSAFFSLGKTFPIIRGIGLDQPAMDYSLALLKHNEWLHLFPEGRVMRDHDQKVISNAERGYQFKWGIAKLILDYFSSSDIKSEIKILPLYHLGMDKILPIGRPYIPKFGHKLTIYIRPSTIDMDNKLLQDILNTRKLTCTKSRSDDEVKRIKLTQYLEEETEKLVVHATELHGSE